MGWALPLDPDVRCLHMGDIRELGNIVAGAFAHPDEAGNGEYLPLVGDFLSFNEIVETLNRQGHKFSFKQVPKEVFAGAFPGAAEIAEMFSYWEAHTYLGSDSSRPNCARKQNSGPATDQLLGVGPSEFPGKGHALMDPRGIVPGLVVTVLWFVVYWQFRAAFYGIFFTEAQSDRSQ